MNIQRLPENIIRWAVIIGGFIFGLFSVKMAAQDQYPRLVLIYSLLGYSALALFLGPRIWVAIPVAWGLSGQIPKLDVPFTVRDLTVMLVFTTCLIFKAFKMFPRSTKYKWQDVMMLLLVLYLVSSFIRNPVGVEAFGSARVGGRPYFNVFIGCMAYWVLSRCSLHARSANKLAIGAAIGRMVEGVMAQFLKWYPSFGSFLAAYYTSPFFTWALEPDTVNFVPGTESTERVGYLLVIGLPLALLLCSYCRPLSIVSPLGLMVRARRFWQLALLVVALTCVLLSGFRSGIAAVVAYFWLASYIWGGMREVGKLMFVSGLALLLIVLCQGTFYELPRSAQRALSFLPGRWDPYAKLEAQDSTRWRTEMWQQMLFTDRYIESHWLGDGFGFSKRDYELMLYFKKYGDTESGQQSFMISGNVHSGPVSTIKYVGYVGLILTLTVLIGMAVAAWQLIVRSRSTPFKYLALFICIPAVIEPFYFTLIFGGFEGALVDGLFTLGMMRMLQNSLDDFAKSKVPVAALSVSDAPALVTRREGTQ